MNDIKIGIIQSSKKMRILGIDYGDKYIGIAVSDPLQLTAQALEKYTIKGEKKDKTYFKQLVDKFSIKEIVVGLPLLMDGREGTRVEKTREFAAWLEQILKIPVILWDERLSTKQALSVLREQGISSRKGKHYENQISACIILSSYLENKRR